MAAKMTAVDFVKKLKTFQSADELKKYERYFPLEKRQKDDEFAGRVQPEERCALLDRELIERKVLGSLADGAVEFPGPGFHALLRPCVDEIE